MNIIQLQFTATCAAHAFVFTGGLCASFLFSAKVVQKFGGRIYTKADKSSKDYLGVPNLKINKNEYIHLSLTQKTIKAIMISSLGVMTGLCIGKITAKFLLMLFKTHLMREFLTIGPCILVGLLAGAIHIPFVESKIGFRKRMLASSPKKEV